MKPIGKVAVLLPGNGINMLVAKAVCSSFLAGNKTLVKLPRKLKHSAACFRQLIASHLPGVEFAPAEQSAEAFLHDCIASADIGAIVIYGDDKWVWSYKNAVRQFNTKLIFEGPGKDPQVVMKDADLELAVTDAVKCGLLNGGQSCSAMERFFVDEEIADEFVERLAGKLSRLKIGSPEDDETDIGPINSSNVIHRMAQQVADAKCQGAKIITGGKPVEAKHTGKFAFLPTIITGCNTTMRVIQEESFGPLFPVISFSSENDLLTKINHSDYGLNASIYGSSSNAFSNYMNNNHRNLYFNSTVTSAENRASRIVDGGFRNSGFIWEWQHNSFVQREGRRMLLKELTA
jgi:acyl-CoA reductase-like NAD-dependent aldehyde dehydrogenase